MNNAINEIRSRHLSPTWSPKYMFTICSILGITFCERLAFFITFLSLKTYMVSMLETSSYVAEAVVVAWVTWSYVSSLLGGYLTDSRLDRFKAIAIAGIVYGIGLIAGSLSTSPIVFEKFPYVPSILTYILLAISLFLTGLCSGVIQVNVGVMLCDQLPHSSKDVFRGMQWFQVATLIGSLVGELLNSPLHDIGEAKHYIDEEGSIATVRVSFWVSFTVAAFIISLSTLGFILAKNVGMTNYKIVPPTPGSIRSLLSISKTAIRNRLTSSGGKFPNWVEYACLTVPRHIVLEVKPNILALQTFFFFVPFYWTLSIYFRQYFFEKSYLNTAEHEYTNASLTLCSLLFAAPLGLFRMLLAKRGIWIGPVKRICIGLIFSSISYFLITFIDFLSIPVEVVIYMFMGLGNVIFTISFLEIGYSQASVSTRSFIVSFVIFSQGIGFGIALILVEFSNHNLNIGLCSASLGLIPIFFFFHRNLDLENLARQQNLYADGVDLVDVSILDRVIEEYTLPDLDEDDDYENTKEDAYLDRFYNDDL